MTTESKNHPTPAPARSARLVKPTNPASPNTRYQVGFRVPPEFLALCERDQVGMVQLLKNFVVDLCGLVPLTKQARHVGRGPQAQKAAQAYYEAAGYGKDGKGQ